jgi:hypothetical protein
MAEPKVFRSIDNPDGFAVSVLDGSRNGCVTLAAVGHDAESDRWKAITIDLSPSDAKALCAELRRVAKLVSEGGGNGAG